MVLYALLFKSLKYVAWGSREGLEVKSTGYSSSGPEFNSQQPYSGLQPSIMKSGTLFWSAGRTLYT